MSTALDIIKGSMRKLGVIATGETPSSNESADGLLNLNNILDSLSNEKLTVYEKVREEFTLTAGQQSRTIGSGGNFNTTRPAWIVGAAIEDQSSSDTPEYPLIILSQEEWANESLKNRSAAIPTKCFFAGTYPLETVYFLEIPNAANKFVLYSLKPFTAFALTSTSVSFPPGYFEYLELELANVWGPEFGKAITPMQDQRRRELKSNIKRQNLGGTKLDAASQVPLGRGGLYDISTGDYR